MLTFLCPFMFAIPDCDELTFAWGELNNDGMLNILDVIHAVNFVLGAIEPTDEQLGAFDFNEDENNDICDIVYGMSPCNGPWGLCD